MNEATQSSALDGAHVVVFGGGSGIGLEAAAAAKANGASVTLVGRTRAKLEAAAQAIGGARIAVADIADRHAVQAVFDTITRVDHLVVTAGRFIAGKLNETDPDHLLAALQERIAGPVYAIRAALPLMPATGSIVLTGGQLSDRPAQGVSVIAAAVRGVEALAQSLALELKPIRVNVVAPGFVETPLYDAFGPDMRDTILAGAASALPGGRVGRADEVGEAIAFLLGNGFMNGEILHIDGGGRLV
ncbi:short-chain dehydrogenase [Burkholderia aenigmatica]|uniref:Short-chain dehydrogenase n=2 Tax=Burkholderia TaxID=32008 RepID=A0ABY6XV97_9BURK|nr:SDR family oxidoreductase [Burkholderia aenigmatica]VWC88491.1 short-chain dehydrogenase [Burkholderia aenigmatica]VWC99118.1 short-chain dehydrogenase [Burkholderia aenigmatica]